MISAVPSSINMSTTPLMITSLLDWIEMIIWPMKDGDGKRTFKLGQIFTMSCHPWDSNAKVKKNPPNSPQQDSPVPCMPCKKILQQLTPGLSFTQWSEDLFPSKKQAIPLLILTFDSSELTLPPFVEPSQYNEPPIPGPSQSSESQVPSHEDAFPHEHEPEVAPTQ
ncbi:hypothetical protein O181_008758 [Austropuccinia psidii MF-1]|uniref:Uncharacterized protein n=1 Tax=Austropuccinia psidii MF-1 TaxID=1389203 RepID=A0A9Q3GIT4_9BASI|nr:hypothetical protein [Austropuccinia psidii MF-1]